MHQCWILVHTSQSQRPGGDGGVVEAAGDCGAQDQREDDIGWQSDDWIPASALQESEEFLQDGDTRSAQT